MSDDKIRSIYAIFVTSAMSDDKMRSIYALWDLNSLTEVTAVDSYIPFETALMFLVIAYLVSVALLLVVADVAIAILENE